MAELIQCTWLIKCDPTWHTHKAYKAQTNKPPNSLVHTIYWISTTHWTTNLKHETNQSALFSNRLYHLGSPYFRGSLVVSFQTNTFYWKPKGLWLAQPSYKPLPCNMNSLVLKHEANSVHLVQESSSNTWRERFHCFLLSLLLAKRLSFNRGFVPILLRKDHVLKNFPSQEDIWWSLLRAHFTCVQSLIICDEIKSVIKKAWPEIKPCFISKTICLIKKDGFFLLGRQQGNCPF